ncbi:MAG: DUF1194 domain-containing protein [Kiloniellales bacterium]
MGRRRVMRTRLAALAAATWFAAVAAATWFAELPAPAAAEPVDLALVLAVDASSSVKPWEFDLQMKGLAKAFRDQAVLNAIKSAAPNGMAVTLVQWSSMDAQVQIFDWALVNDRASAERVAQEIDRAPRVVTGGATAISQAIDFSIRLLLAVPARRRVIDVSGDGRDNQAGGPITARRRALAAGVTINGLAILNEDPTLELYYLLQVIAGEGSFVLMADDFDDFADAIRIKLIKEISGAPSADRRRQPSIFATTTPNRGIFGEPG